jgi:peptide chain release factor 1
MAQVEQARRSQVRSGDRSEKIRTYNFPQNRVTDHRIGLTSHRLEGILDGELDEFVHELASADQATALQEAS